MESVKKKLSKMIAEIGRDCEDLEDEAAIHEGEAERKREKIRQNREDVAELQRLLDTYDK